MCCFLRKHDYLPETRKEMGGNMIRLAHWLTVTSWSVAFYAYMSNDQASWGRLFTSAIVFGGMGAVVFTMGARMRDKARLDIRARENNVKSGRPERAIRKRGADQY